MELRSAHQHPRLRQTKGCTSPPTGSDADVELFTQLYPSLRRFAAMWVVPGVEPDDLVQQALANVIQNQSLSNLDNPQAYLRRAITNIAHNEFRRSSREDRGGGGIFKPVLGASDTYPSDVEWLLELAPDERAALLLVDVEGSTYKEAAQSLGMSARAVKGVLRRARRTARRIHESTGQDD